MTLERIELLCSRELALRLGAIEIGSSRGHLALLATQLYMVVRDTRTGLPLLWAYVDSRESDFNAKPQ